MKLHSYDEFTRLKTVVLGIYDENSHGLESQDPNAEIEQALKLIKKASPDWYIDEVREDINGFEDVLRSFDIDIIRPSWPFKDSLYRSPTCVTSGYDLYNVRDNHIVFGDKLISSPPSGRYRLNEHFGFYSRFKEIHSQNPFSWIHAPRPSLPQGFELPLNKAPTVLEINESKKHARLSGDLHESHISLAESEIVFDAANIIPHANPSFITGDPLCPGNTRADTIKSSSSYCFISKNSFVVIFIGISDSSNILPNLS